ncbi:MAG: type II toxin-antitoxin system VapC family toxin [Eggerthella lenta]
MSSGSVPHRQMMFSIRSPAGGKPSLAVQLKRDLKELRRGVRICGVNEVEFDTALDSSWVDLEDACVYQCALKLKADAIITRNQKDFEKSSIKVFDCDELFAYLAEEKRPHLRGDTVVGIYA